MLIKNIPVKKIRREAKQILISNRVKSDHVEGVIDTFDFQSEGFNFWVAISEGDYLKALELNRDLFGPTRRDIEDAYTENLKREYTAK